MTQNRMLGSFAMQAGAARQRPLETRWIELAPETAQLDFGDAVRSGLGKAAKTLPSQFFYDAEGSRLFDAICDLPEYYLTRVESEILDAAAIDLAQRFPTVRTLVELGSGSALKTEKLLRAFSRDRALCYAPIDVSRSALEDSIERLEQTHPGLQMRPAVAEYEAGLIELAGIDLGPTLMLWLGSSIGNLEKPAASDFLRGVGANMRPDDRLLVGIDLRKDRATLEAAYDDAAGVTARFNLNLLARINHELDGHFDLTTFRHVVHYDEDSGSVQSFLESQIDQRIAIGALDLEIPFLAGERIHTEDSHKYSIHEIDALAEQAGLAVERRYFDSARRFSLNLLATQPVPRRRR